MNNMNGKIIKGIGGFYYVKTAENTIYECRARGVFRKDNIKPYIGDDVEIETVNGKGNVVKIFPRRSMLIRPPVANIDILAVVAAAASPKPNPFLIDKLLVNAEINGIEPIICINKTDLASAAELEEIYSKTGYKIITMSAGQESGMSELTDYIKGKTTAFAGLSGVGKSTILNLLTDTEQKTGSVSEKIQRGRHTTRHVELLELPYGGYVLDTPGFSSFEVNGIKASELENHFPEIRGSGLDCRFKGCSHINEPDCEVKKRLECGKISQIRYESYVEMYNKLKNVKEWENK